MLLVICIYDFFFLLKHMIGSFRLEYRILEEDFVGIKMIDVGKV